jgi:hypothetical protein
MVAISSFALLEIGLRREVVESRVEPEDLIRVDR